MRCKNNYLLAVLVLLLASSSLTTVEAGFLRDRLQGHKHSQGGSHGLGIADENWAPAGVKRLANLAYGSDPLQQLDVYLPQVKKQTPTPTILMVHGGGWRRGDKGAKQGLENKLNYWVVQQGYAFVSINYRLTPEANPLEEADDVAAALTYTQKNAAQWGADPNRLILMGYSAGAHLVALLAANPEAAFRHGAMRWQGTVVLDSGALDLLSIMNRRHPSMYDNAFGSDPEFWRRASPLEQLTRNATPLFIVCSTKRVDKPCTEAQRFYTKAHGFGIEAGLYPVDEGHAGVTGELGKAGAYTSAVDAFIQRHVGR